MHGDRGVHLHMRPLLLALAVALAQAQMVEDTARRTTLRTGKLRMHVEKPGFRFWFEGHTRPHPESGLLVAGRAVGECRFHGRRSELYRWQCEDASVSVLLRERHAWLSVRLPEPRAVAFRLGGAAPGYGLGDHAALERLSTDVTGFSSDSFRSGQGFARMISNFVIYPRHGFALVLIDPRPKIIRSSEQEIAQGSVETLEVTDFHLFFGTPREIYREYLRVRNERGYPVLRPKYELFGVGWEAWGALAWQTNQRAVTDNVNRYLDSGYPLRWMVVGSGFWPRHEAKFHATTSFGLYDPVLYPDPKSLIRHFHSRGLKFLQGLRIAFIPEGPFTSEGARSGFFFGENGRPMLFRIDFPKSPCYLLDAYNPRAVAWYMGLVKRWTDFGVDGFKEDLYGYGRYVLRDDKLEPVNREHMRLGHYLIGRNAYLGSAADIHRIDDFNYYHHQDRGPVNALALAYSGLPLVYPDIVGGTFAEKPLDLRDQRRVRFYMMRNAMWAALHPAMSFGQPPWAFQEPKVSEVMRKAAHLHDRLLPYIYSQAVRFYQEGFPWPMSPLPLVFPDDPQVHGRENAQVRGYQWMIGDALLATPLYGDDYHTAQTRDVYLPAGLWMDYETGERYRGPGVLKGFPLFPEKIPLFVGGTGIVLEQEEGKLWVRVYPVSSSAETVLWHRDGQTVSRIRLRVADWAKAAARELRSGRRVPVQWRRHALAFELTPGAEYEVR